MNIKFYLDYLYEGIVFDDKTISVDLYKFLNKSKKELYIIGLSGAGKTTLSKKLQLKNIDSTDDCPFDADRWYKGDKKERDLMFQEYIECSSEKILNTKGILEGIGIFEAYTRNEKVKKKILDSPCIIIGTSAFKSSYRAYMRQHRFHKSIKRFFQNGYLHKNLFNYLPQLNTLRKDRINVKGSIIEQFNVNTEN